jgi:hypothetical protein
LWSVDTGVAAWLDRGSSQEIIASDDGAVFNNVSAMPVLGQDTLVDQVLGIARIAYPGGGVKWLLLLEHVMVDADQGPVPGSGINLWQLEPTGVWTTVWAFGGEAIGGALATSGARIGVIATVGVTGSDVDARRQTVLSGDQGATFVEAQDDAGVSADCRPVLAISGDQGVLACDEVDGPVIRHAGLWAP